MTPNEGPNVPTVGASLYHLSRAANPCGYGISLPSSNIANLCDRSHFAASLPFAASVLARISSNPVLIGF